MACTAAALCMLSSDAVCRAAGPPLTRIAFGSCCQQNQPAPIWDAIVESQPDLFLMIGDNIYGDTEDMDVMWEKYQTLGRQAGFKRLRKTCPILATWDDHDYGRNDAGVEYLKKAESQQLFLDFFGIAKDSHRRTRQGVYSSHVFGPPGQRVQILLLDTRYFRGPLTRSQRQVEPGEGYRGIYRPATDTRATILGEAQWTWLEEQLRQPAEVRIIASSIQVLPNQHGWEMWGNFPHERQRLFDTIRRTHADGVLLISGDRHLAEQMRIDPAESGIGYPLAETTSSSLNQPSGNFTKSGHRFANELNRYRQGLTYFETNFGVVRIDWTAADPIVRLQVRDSKGGIVLQQRFSLSELRPPTRR